MSRVEYRGTAKDPPYCLYGLLRPVFVFNTLLIRTSSFYMSHNLRQQEHPSSGLHAKELLPNSNPFVELPSKTICLSLQDLIHQNTFRHGCFGESELPLSGLRPTEVPLLHEVHSKEFVSHKIFIHQNT